MNGTSAEHLLYTVSWSSTLINRISCSSKRHELYLLSMRYRQQLLPYLGNAWLIRDHPATLLQIRFTLTRTPIYGFSFSRLLCEPPRVHCSRVSLHDSIVSLPQLPAFHFEADLDPAFTLMWPASKNSADPDTQNYCNYRYQNDPPWCWNADAGLTLLTIFSGQSGILSFIFIFSILYTVRKLKKFPFYYTYIFKRFFCKQLINLNKITSVYVFIVYNLLFIIFLKMPDRRHPVSPVYRN